LGTGKTWGASYVFDETCPVTASRDRKGAVLLNSSSGAEIRLVIATRNENRFLTGAAREGHRVSCEQLQGVTATARRVRSTRRGRQAFPISGEVVSSASPAYTAIEDNIIF
jgi:hypothetical protein